MKKINEFIGDSFYEYLANLPDLVLIMDESHHYRAKKGMEALNELKPLMGLELTATPIVTSGSKQIPFKNVVYEYPLSKAIEDGYTRTPFAGTRSDINFYNFGEEELDKIMLLDGLKLHERAKMELEAYALNNSTDENEVRKVKPFMMVVCKDTDHAKWVEDYIKSDEFEGGAYRNKTIIVHSKQKGSDIPRLKVTDEGVVEYGFVDFDLDLSEFNHAPIRNDLLIQNLEDLSDLQRIDGDAIDFDGYNPKKAILELLRTKPEIDYEKCSELLFKLISQVVNYYEKKYDTNLMQNIVMMNKKDIANKIYHQMVQDNHFYCENGFIKYSVMDTREYNLTQTYTWDKRLNLYESNNGNIKSILFEGIKKGVFSRLMAASLRSQT